MRNGDYELVKAPDGYPGKKYRGKYCYEHHLVWWQNTGRVPQKGEVIHHRNHKKRDNRFENLGLLTKSEHTRHHATTGRTMVSLVCPSCGARFERERRATHLVKKSRRTFCSRACIGRAHGRGR